MDFTALTGNPLVMAGGAAALILLAGLVIAMRMGGSNEVEARLERFGTVDKARKEQLDKAAARDAASVISARLEKAIAGRGFTAQTAKRLAQADIKLTVSEFLMIKIAAIAVGAALGLYIGRGAEAFSFVFGIIGGIIGLFVPDFYVGYMRGKRIKSFNNQLGDTIGLMANSLRSGYSMLQSMELVAREGAAPMSDEFKRVVREVGLGLSSQEALNNLLRRMPSDDLDLLITAVNIQYEVGGNLAQILDTIAHTIRERVRIKGEIAALTAQGIISSYILCGIPVLVGAFLMTINPEYMGRMFVWPWICMPICAGIMVVFGFIIIQKIVRIDI
jgi:tight adherence protein B